MDRELMADALDVFGFQGQLIALAEEAGELAAAAARLANDKGTCRDVVEEVIGVENVVQSIRHRLALEDAWAEVRAEQEAKLRAKLQQRKQRREG